jgi:signal transduction histidine kinase
MPRTNSLALRIVASAAVLSVLVLFAGAIALVGVFRDSVESSFDAELADEMKDVLAVAELDCAGSLTMPVPLIASRFLTAFSGSYWQIASVELIDGKPVQTMQSDSLADVTLRLGDWKAPKGSVRKGYVAGPNKQSLRFVEGVFELSKEDPENDATVCTGRKSYRFAVAGDLAQVEEDIANFRTTLMLSALGLAGALLVAMIVQVRVGLAPLDEVSRSLAAIREGRAAKLEGQFPAEIQPLADELNALVAHNEEVIARARTHVSNLAHFLKTPLSVIANEVHGQSGPMAESIARQAQVMRRQVDHYLTRARTVASAKVIGARTEAAPVINDLTRALSKIYAPRGIRIERACPDGLSFRGDRSDFEEMVGNLLDNACKWADGEVTVTVSSGQRGRLTVAVADNGPGLTGEQAARVIERGERLDESKPGSGLGLGIVKEIASLYGGTLTLGRVDTGGLSAILDLPAVERSAS